MYVLSTTNEHNELFFSFGMESRCIKNKEQRNNLKINTDMSIFEYKYQKIFKKERRWLCSYYLDCTSNFKNKENVLI